MLEGQQYDYRVDIWALGILLYELLHGYAPFEGDNVEEVKIAMRTSSINFSSQISGEVADLISKILHQNP